MPRVPSIMERYRAPAAVEPQPVVQPEGKKLRRKLQKIGNRRNSFQFTPSNAKAAEPQGFLKSVFTSKKTEPAKATSRMTAPGPMPIDLSDHKWAEYLRTSRYTANEVEFLPQPSNQEPVTPPADVVPEFAHLNVTNDKPRESLDTVSTDGPATPSSSVSAGSAARRYAKTPVTRIGQLEAVAAREPALTQNALSIDQIAESYRALLNSRASMLEERFMTPFQTAEEIPSDLGLRSYEQFGASAVTTFLDLPRTPRTDMGSPTYSDRTLVGYEEDAIYFKPMSFASDLPPSERVEIRSVPRNIMSVTSMSPENPTIQIIFDLLMKELLAAASINILRPSAQTSALEIWLMIETYEKLKEKIENMGLDPDQARSVQAMFNMWLRTLHTIHDNMTGNDGRASESDYGE